jgi:hypothetical protein
MIKRLVWEWLRYYGPGNRSGRAVDQLLGVSHTYVQKLVREFATDSSRMEWMERSYGRPTFEQLRRAV